jgi:signal transduction histidine kinase
MEDLRIEISQSLLKSQSELAAETLRRQDQSRLLSMLMHEIKTPLAVIDMAMASRTKEDKATGYIERAIDNMKSILDRCVQTDRMIDRGFQINRQTLQLSKQIENWVQERKEGPDRFGLTLQSNLQIDSDLQCLQIIVNNLIENAFKHGHPTAPLVIKVEGNHWESGQAGVLLSFTNLPGASAWPDEAQLFGKYYRSGPAQRVSGTGLGLYLSRNLAEQLGGSLRYRTDQLHLIFELWLPS